jgi:UDP-N-acetylglucosamine 2-epimerase
MSTVFFEELNIPEPDYNLGVGSASHGKQTGEMLERIESVLLEEEPELVLVYGDTNSTLAGALAAVKLHIPVAHVEAGLRSFNRAMPEEINRVLTDHASDVLFCPTDTAVQNLSAEGMTSGVHNVGDVMYDALLYNIEIAQQRSHILDQFQIMPEEYLLVTAHRPRNTDHRDRLLSILDALNQIDDSIIFPAHPRTQKAIEELDYRFDPHIRLIEPVGYLDMLVLAKHARKILTDSGGVQKEAYLLGTPCITLREETEWIETLSDGWNTLAGADRERIVTLVEHHTPEAERQPVFGDGQASQKILAILEQFV